MKQVSEIVTIMYGILNVDQVTDLLTKGKPDRYNRGEEDRGTSVVIVPLAHENDFVTEGVMNVNVHAPTVSDNSVDEATLTEITDNVIEVIEAYTNDTNYMEFEIQGQNMVTDEREQTYVNIRINYFCEQ